MSDSGAQQLASELSKWRHSRREIGDRTEGWKQVLGASTPGTPHDPGLQLRPASAVVPPNFNRGRKTASTSGSYGDVYDQNQTKIPVQTTCKGPIWGPRNTYRIEPDGEAPKHSRPQRRRRRAARRVRVRVGNTHRK